VTNGAGSKNKPTTFPRIPTPSLLQYLDPEPRDQDVTTPSKHRHSPRKRYRVFKGIECSIHRLIEDLGLGAEREKENDEFSSKIDRRK
jgi:hypothetical protein